MDLEFHYYITYLIAVKAGFKKSAAETLAYASQYIDDNDYIFDISPETPAHYQNYISQTKDIIQPRKKLFRIYPIFHFIPGNPLQKSARRKDGKLHYLNTIPANQNANRILAEALNSHNIYQIGLAIHSFADTYAHQNFVGYYDTFNSLKGILKRSPAKIGHASATHKPDIPNLIWQDKRLCNLLATRNNKALFLQAAASIFVKLKRYNQPEVSNLEVESETKELIADLTSAIGETTTEYNFFKNTLSNLLKKGSRQQRINNYRALALKEKYGGQELAEYDSNKWLKQILEDTFQFKLFKLLKKFPLLGLGIEIITDKIKEIFSFDLSLNYKWKDKLTYQKSHWYKFQQAVKEVQARSEKIIGKSVFSKMDLAKF